MIKIFNVNEVDRDEIFCRVQPTASVETPVAEILKDVK